MLDQLFPGSRLSGAANLLVMPNLDAANITMKAPSPAPLATSPSPSTGNRASGNIAKNAFEVHGVDRRGHVVPSKRLSRGGALAVFVNRPPAGLVLKACGRAHDGARELQSPVMIQAAMVTVRRAPQI